MKSVVIVTDNMRMGGTEKALISMLETFQNQKYKVTLLLPSKEGYLYDSIPSWVNIKIIPYYDIKKKYLFKYYLKNRNFIKIIKMFIYLFLIRFETYYSQLNTKCKIIPNIDEEYDLAISYGFPLQFQDWYTINNIKAKKKVVWVHSDVSKLLKDSPLKYYENMYIKYDKIFCVSNECKKKFAEKFTNIQTDRIEVFYNIIDKEKIVSQAKYGEGYSDNFDGIRILTVGRLSKEKGQDMIPSVLLRLIRDGYNIKWYCIGDGELREEINDKIKLNKLDNNLILLGTKSNPYRYMSECNIYVQPSIYEAYCITVAEARCFNKPIIVTNFTGADEQIINCKTGYIVNRDEEELYKKIKVLLDSNEIMREFQLNLEKESFNTYGELKKIDKLFD